SNTALTLATSSAATATVSGANYAVGVTFLTKAKNAKTAGAAGVIVFNHDVCGGVAADITPALTLASLGDVPPFIFIAEADGLSLKNTPASTVSVAMDDHRFA